MEEKKTVEGAFFIFDRFFNFKIFFMNIKQKLSREPE